MIVECQKLTPRELEISLLVAQGLSDKEIARRLSISLQTARNHVSNALHKECLDNRCKLALKYAYFRETN
jgi:two-component system nitrate/nitrite response regulator NarL